jgi:hypothetical protein
MNQLTAVREALSVAVAANLPVILWGSPGSGKTSTVLALGASLDLPVEVVVGSIREPSDFAGLPVLRDGHTWFAPPRWAERLANAGSGLLFLDELTTAPPAVQAAMLRVVLERTVGDLSLPPEVRIIAAANPPEEAADGWDLSAPLANRLIHLHWQVDATAIADGFTHGFPVPEVAHKQAPTAAGIARRRAMIGSFLRIRPELLLVVPSTPELAGRAWPSPRTWEMAAMVLAACEADCADEAVRAQLLFGTVGEAAAFELLSWLINLDLPDPATLLANPDLKLPTRTDQLHALLGAVVGHVRADGTAETWQQAWQVIAQVARNTPDVAASTARGLAQCRPAGTSLPTAMLDLVPILRAAGLMR